MTTRAKIALPLLMATMYESWYVPALTTVTVFVASVNAPAVLPAPAVVSGADAARDAAALDGGARIITLCDTVGDSEPDGARRIVEFVRALLQREGHQAAIWSVGNRTFVLVAREPRAEVERMTAFVHGALR